MQLGMRREDGKVLRFALRECGVGKWWKCDCGVKWARIVGIGCNDSMGECSVLWECSVKRMVRARCGFIIRMYDFRMCMCALFMRILFWSWWK